MPESATSLPVQLAREAPLLDAKNFGQIQEWIGTKELANIAEMTVRSAQIATVSCLSGGTWRGVRLEVRYEGRALMIYAPSLPADLREIWHERYKASEAAVTPEKLTLPAPDSYSDRIGADYALRRWKLNLIASALQFPKFSRARGEALRDIVGIEHIRPDGRPFTPSLSTLQTWLKAFEGDGEVALGRKARAAEGPRVLISRAWDAACPLPGTTKESIALNLSTHVKSLWAEGAPGWRRINQLASAELLSQCKAAGWKGANLKNCAPGRAFVEKFREFSLIAIKEKNAKLFFDKHTPRITRSRKGYRPGDIVIGDVHPHDVVREIDGRKVHARLISWLDVATYDIFVSVITLPEGRSVRREDVAASFVDMVKAWGLPRQLRLDNGSEYKWDTMIKGFETLAGLVSAFQAFHASIMGKDEVSEAIDAEQFQAISRARPYNAQAKQIEHVFSIIEHSFFSMMPGWIGGDRINKRTQNVGQAPVAYRGSDDDYVNDMSICLDLYRNTPQKDGSSPNEKRRAAEAQGYKAIEVPLPTFIFAFSDVLKAKVQTRGITVENQLYFADLLVPLIGKTIEVRYAKWAREGVFYLDGDGKLHAIPAYSDFLQEDGKGAKEQSRRNGIKLQQVRDLKSQTKKIDLLAEATRFNAAMPPPPTIPMGLTITTVEGEAIADALKNAVAPAAAIKLQPGQIQHPTTGEILSLAGPSKEKGPKPTDIDFDPLNFEAALHVTNRTVPKEPEFDLIQALTERHDSNRKDV